MVFASGLFPYVSWSTWRDFHCRTDDLIRLDSSFNWVVHEDKKEIILSSFKSRFREFRVGAIALRREVVKLPYEGKGGGRGGEE
jgi:hypothetical protein